MLNTPRIALIHALRESMEPIWSAFSKSWPVAQTFNLLDDSLSADLAQEGKLTDAIIDRFVTLGRYACNAGAGEKTTDAILFTCSAFGPAIEAVEHDLEIPVLTPNEAAFDDAIAIGSRIGLMVTFPPSEPALIKKLEDLAKTKGVEIDITSTVVAEALATLQAGDPSRHDELISDEAEALDDIDCIVLGQFSMARAAENVARRVDVPVITTPAAAVDRLRTLLGN
jgi:Asp/Glu/hydantoin racemase